MACCAFAILLVSQLLLPFRAAARLFGWAPKQLPDRGVMWRPGQSPPPQERPRWKHVALGVAGFNAALVLLFAYIGSFDIGRPLAPSDTRVEKLEAVFHAAICGPSWRRG